MARESLPLGTWGKITREKVVEGRYRARARYRDYDGATRHVERHGPTAAKAETALLAALRDRAQRDGAAATITPKTPLAELADAWIAQRRDEGKIAEQTVEQYERLIRVHIVPSLGKVKISEASVGTLDRFIRAVPGATTSKQCRTILSGMMRLAAQHDAIKHNPARETTRRTSERKKARALTIEELATLRRRVDAWAGANRFGKPRGPEIPDLFDVMLGTGCRIGEVLALQWDDVELGGLDKHGERLPSYVTVTGTVVGSKRQPFPKSDASHRRMKLPEFAADALRRQLARDIPTDEDLVWPSRSGGIRTTANVRRQLREAREHVEHEHAKLDEYPADYFDWVTPHSARRTVATIIERETGAESAAGQLGHTTPDITRRHYIERATDAPDSTAALDKLARQSAG